MKPSEVIIPERLRERPVFQGLVVPYMVQIDDRGIPDFRVTDTEKHIACVFNQLCGICGQKLEQPMYFIGGDISERTRWFFDPPMHRECCAYSLEVCPYMAMPNWTYREAAPHIDRDGHALLKDMTQTERPPKMMVGLANGFVFKFDPPGQVARIIMRASPWIEVIWFERGEEAAEVLNGRKD